MSNPLKDTIWDPYFKPPSLVKFGERQFYEIVTVWGSFATFRPKKPKPQRFHGVRCLTIWGWTDRHGRKEKYNRIRKHPVSFLLEVLTIWGLMPIGKPDDLGKRVFGRISDRLELCTRETRPRSVVAHF